MKKILTHRFGIHLIIGILILFIFGRSLNNGLALDDNFVINDQTKQGVSAIPTLFTSHYYNFNGETSDYRPITMVTFAIESSLHNNDEMLSHLFNLVLYFFVCLLTYWFLLRLIPDKNSYLPLVILTLFLIHPIHVEVVASLKNRDEMLAAIFGFMACLVHLKETKTKLSEILKWIGVVLLLSFSIMSKKSGASFIGVIVLTNLFLKDWSMKELGKNLIFVVPMLVVKFTRRTYGLTTSNRINYLRENPLYLEPLTFVDRIPIASNILLEYLYLFLWPKHLSFYYGHSYVVLQGWETAIGVLSFIGVLVALSVALYYFKSKWLPSYGILFFLGTGALFSNLFKPLPGIMAERFVFVPILGLCIVLGYFLMRLYQSNRYRTLGAVLGISFFVLLSAKSIGRTGDWYSSEKLFNKDIEHLEHSAMANYMYAEMITADPKIALNYSAEDKFKHYKRSYQADTTFSDAYFGAGMIQLTLLKNQQAALNHFAKSLEIDTLYDKGFYGLGMLLKENNEYDQALKGFRRAFELSEGEIIIAKYEEVKILIYLSRLGEAKKACFEGLSARRKDPSLNGYMGDIYRLENKIDTALFYYQKSYEMKPHPRIKAQIRELKNK